MRTRIASATSTSLAAVSLLVLSAACRGRDDRAQADSAAHATTASGSVVPASDSAGTISSTTPAVGPGIQVTTTDQHEVERSMDLKLTDDNWSKFTKAADSVAALRARDAEVRQYLEQQIVGAREDDAGRKWLEANPKVAAAITTSGLSVKDYYRLGLTIAAAARFADNPSAAPPTPAGRENAEFVRAHAGELQHIRSLSAGPGVRAQ